MSEVPVLPDDFMQSACSECGGPVRPDTVTQEYRRDGVTASVSGIPAFTCKQCGAVYFAPDGAQTLVEAANALLELAQSGQQPCQQLVAVEGDEAARSLRGTILRYDDPFEPAVPPEEWEALN